VRRGSVAAGIAAAGIALLAAGCGSTGSHGAQATGALAFSHCMRSHGVVHWPDPTSGGAIPKESLQQLGISSSGFQSAQSACQHLRPTESAARQRLVVSQSLEFSRCVRNHGVPNFPDPDSTGRIPDPASVGIDQGSPRFEAANQACGKYRPPYMPSNAAYNAYAKTQG
jgi:hypothetical protein